MKRTMVKGLIGNGLVLTTNSSKVAEYLSDPIYGEMYSNLSPVSIAVYK